MTRAGKDERGTVVVLTAMIAVAAMLMVALVVDLGQLRLDRRSEKSLTDLAARAGITRLPFGPWSGVCKAREFLLGNLAGISSFDAGSETWSDAAAHVYGTSPCPQVASAPDAVACLPNVPSTWAKFQATAGQGRFTVEIQSGYVLPDPRFSEDVGLGDTGASDQGSCDNLAVILTQKQPPNFAQVAGQGSRFVRVRSVGRLNATETLDFVAALQLLEQHKCGVLQTGGANTRVIAQPFGVYPGTVQIDSAGDSGSCPQPIINAQATSGGPSVLACSTNSTNTDCRPGTGTRPSRVGVYAANFNKPANIVSTAYPSTYGDTRIVGSPRTGRKYTDLRYLANVTALDQSAKNVLTGNSGRPPGCATVLLNACTGNGITWLVLQPVDCTALAAFFVVPGRVSAQNIWFNCDLNVTTPLTLSAANSYLVVTGQLAVNSTFTVTDPRKVYVGGRVGGNAIGADLSGSASVLNMNMGGASACSGRTGPGHANQLVVGNGSLKVGASATVRICQTFTYMASGFGKVPATNGTTLCSSCGTYTGTISVSSGGFVDLSAANEITGRLPTATELASTYPFEDLALWTEAGGNANGLSGGSATKMTGVFFLPNADSFTLAGGGSLPIDLSAQFVADTMQVTGGATVNLVPNPEDSVPVTIYTVLLVR
ncbi:MAG TPA: Tad domain-containing protein [Acidimicrobiales bacterium]|nr:Tad domain-containing protein [Acidimicrobiales bacterium]